MTVLVTGGAGFIGANVVDRLLRSGERVRVLYNFSRAGVEQNVEWLHRTHGKHFELVVGDVRDAATVNRAVDGSSDIFHFAAQVAVTTSLADPHADFATNGLGTLNVLEAARRQSQPPHLLYTSTNRVYGALEDVVLEETRMRHEPQNHELAVFGIGESRALEFHSPYGCSKGTADQYVLDYARMFGIPAAVLRMGCIYGPHQFGNEDQGWLAHFVLRAIRNEPITIYGDGRQVRDALFVEDLIDAMLRVRSQADELRGRVFNVGGGPKQAVSLVELVQLIQRKVGRQLRLAFEPWRLADPKWFVSDTRALEKATGWRPRVGVDEGVSRLHDWLASEVGPKKMTAPLQVMS